MKIKQLTLVGYKRLMLNNINKLVLKPESIYQLILGTNGSGKSSVLHELGPLPAIASNYIKGGYKEIIIEHRGFVYTLTSSFKSGNKHSFIKGEEELNPGGTQAVQKELVETEFLITGELHELLIGKTLFTQFSPAKRREWFTKICHVDFTYALNTYQRLKSAARDAQGALKHVKQRHGNETNKLLAIGDLSAIETEYQILHNELNILFAERTNKTRPSYDLESEIETLLESTTKLSTVLVDKAPSIPANYSFTSLQDIESYLNEITNKRLVNEELRNRIAKELEENQGILEGFKEAGVESITGLKQEIDVLKTQRYQLIRNLETFRELSFDAFEVYAEYQQASGDLINALTTLPVNEHKQFNKGKIKEFKEALPDKQLMLEKINNRIAYFESRLETIDTAEKQECPECRYKWTPGYSEKDRAYALSELERFKGLKVKAQGIVLEYREYLEKADDYVQHFYALKQIINGFPKLKDLTEIFFNDERIYSEPTSLVNYVYAFGKDLELHYSARKLTERLETLEKLYSTQSAEKHLNDSMGKIEGLEKELETITRSLLSINNEISLLKRFKDYVRVYLEKHELLEEKLATLKRYREECIASYRNESIGDLIKNHQNRLAGLQSKRTEKQSLEDIINDLSTDQQQLEQDTELLGLLANELSPTDGLIAEQLTGFIEGFISHVNQIIASIWTYELKVLPCGLESGDLNYKFPLHVKQEGRDNNPPDISDGSEAQMEVVNLAFRLVTMAYLNMEEYPVYLDEAGRTFDEQHRLNLLTFIKQLVDTGNYTQLFIISHYAPQFNVFVNSEILLLDSSNITAPKNSNTHVTLE